LQTASNSSGSDAAGGGKWPVLARLTEVPESPEAVGTPSRGTTVGSATIRFDPPQRQNHAPAPAQQPQAPTNARLSSARLIAESKVALSAERAGASLLPANDPFSLPRPSIVGRLAPLAQFLTLFVLFTILGTLFLRSGHQVKPAEGIEPATTAAQQVLEPQLPGAAVDVEPPSVAPTAAGPIGNGAARTGLRTNEEKPSHNRGSRAGLTHDQQVVANADALPQLQTSDAAAGRQLAAPRPIVVARLSGHVEAPSQQAQHDDHRSSLH
jgi:hypothetical protein